ncbi:MAG TPA: GNAT family N-acetyltransferase [Lachnospiraceae bacterium]|nr:GNAT family N-acetyltransferase [Lachnospiraceae bacterium]
MINSLETGRLMLIPITLEIARELLQGGRKEMEKLGVIMDSNWPTDDTMDILPIILQSLEVSKEPSGFETWMIVRKDDRRVIGDIGFFGKPNEEGEVQIGYGLVKQEHGKGYGTEALKAIVDWALSQEEVKVIQADCLLDNITSASILRKVGMQETKRDEELIYWEYRK